MISRPVEDLKIDYDSPAAALRDAGLASSLLYDVDGLRFSITPTFAREATLLLMTRPRGTFVRSNRGHVYRVTGAQSTGQLCVELLRRLGTDTVAQLNGNIFHRQGLSEEASWEDDERSDRTAAFQANGWIEVSEHSKKQLWNEFETHLGPERQKEPTSSVTWDISEAYAEDLSTDTETDLTLKTLHAMRTASEPSEPWYVFSDYAALSGFLPWQFSQKPYGRWWKNPILPRGAPPHMNVRTFHNCFVRNDFRAGILTFLREDSLCVFGEDLLAALSSPPPALLKRVRRRDGAPVL